MINDLKISLLQANIVWENPSENHALMERFFNTQTPKTDLIVLPEMFSSGFTREFTETAPYPSLLWMKEMAKSQDSSIYGSLAVTDNDKAYNRGFWVEASGAETVYDKKHLFKYGKEHETFTGGNSIVQTSIGSWTFRPLICYDLRFPVWSRNVNSQYDVLIYVASWPELRINAWNSLLKARAIENQCYVIGVNRTGLDGYGLNYSGDSCVIDFKGDILLDAEDKEGRFDVTLSFDELQAFRQKFPFLDDADSWQFI